MEGIGDLKRLLDFVSGRALLDDDFRRRMDGLSPEGRANDLKRIAQEISVDPEVVDNFDLAGIEENSLQAFIGETNFRFFRDDSLGPER